MLWFMWLLFLCFTQTHPDAIHLIKRFGLVAASQLPIHILLSTKMIVPPLGFLMQTSNRWNMTIHKIGGRIIIGFFGLHSLGYTTVLVQNQIFGSMAQQPQIVAAILSSVTFAIIGVTSSRPFRLRWYSLFHKIHYVGSITALLLLFFHNNPIKMYIIESLVALCLKKIAETATTAPSSP
ncbi:uncharacterized protein FPRO_05609 [Fusarium proliferatum ET1]|uniref:Ferric oxidoreductase domain-containing protein n=1 Tax=Fusarium proliferatum (strain ET1) TaxID=1227346 RepID=A0A1L7VEU8_FUSPR|nr:uncharacterized protein FPRO_05609 [Fusarium proliferatum ET1]CZR39199.1 uncharacterized protein FPRO_05609 [Fusarium proliferatum ET1]